jgi:glycosyltransferase involved in cell wall biosynthesis
MLPGRCGKVRVLYVSHTGLVSGAERALLDLLDALPNTIHPVVACPRGPLSDALSCRHVEVRDLPEVSGSFRLHPVHSPTLMWQLMMAGLALHRVVRSSRPDVIHANSLRAGLVSAAALASRSAPVIVHAHDILPSTRSGAAVRAALRPSINRLVAVSDYTARSFVDGGFSQPVHMLHNPLDIDRFDPRLRSRADARAELGLEPDQRLLGMVAQVTPWKGQELAIRATAVVRETFPSIKLLIVGEAKFTSTATRFDNAGYLSSLHQLVDELGLQHNVEFMGQRQDVETIMRSLDVSLAPSWEEPFGRAVVEAMAVETPIVATNVGGPPEYINDGVDGFLLPPRDLVAWTDLLTSLLGEPGRRSEMGRRASLKVRALFDRRDYVDKVVAVYETALGCSRLQGAEPDPAAAGWV